jgi:hypothetical protein
MSSLALAQDDFRDFITLINGGVEQREPGIIKGLLCLKILFISPLCLFDTDLLLLLRALDVSIGDQLLWATFIITVIVIIKGR